jgi:hypothetical protein
MVGGKRSEEEERMDLSLLLGREKGKRVEVGEARRRRGMRRRRRRRA